MASDDKLKRTIKTENMEMRQSPPKAIVDCSPLQPAISKNKEGNFVYSSLLPHNYMHINWNYELIYYAFQH